MYKSILPETIGGSHVFLRSKTGNDRKRLSKSRYSTTFQLGFVSIEKSLVKNYVHVPSSV